MTDGFRLRVAVIGCGAAGMMAGIAAAENGADVTVLERNPFAGKKLRITGKGRCNVTNDCTPREFFDAVPTNPKFLMGVINRFTPADTMDFFTSAGVPLKTERGRRVFPVSDKAVDIAAALTAKMREYGVRVLYESRVIGIDVHDGGSFDLRLSREGNGAKIVSCDRVILATGGVSYPLTGSTGDGHRILGKLGVSVTELKPSLVPIVTKENFSPMTGLSLKNVRLSASHGGKEVFTEMGEMLFTHFGISGPLVLSASSNMQKFPVGEYEMRLDLKPALSREELDRRVISDFSKYAAKDFINALGDLLPVKLIEYVVAQSQIDPRKKTGSVTKEERAALVDVLKGFVITPVAFRPIDEAIITSGGVAVSEINPKTMELKAHPGIYVCGELIDVDAYTGGYNLQIAFSTGRAAGLAASSWEW